MKPPRKNKSNAPRTSSSGGKGDKVWLFGIHACAAALQNPERIIHRAALTANVRQDWQGPLAKRRVEASVVETRELADSLPPGAVHQGIALLVSPLPSASLEDLQGEGPSLVLALDQVTDPHNVGAILRSCAAFDVAALIVTEDHAPQESGTLAKSACGALELVPVVRIVNLADTIGKLKKQGYWVAGLDGEATQTLAQANLSGKLLLILGAEGKGLRQLTRKHCDFLVKLPISPRMESLNVSNAAAVALYELRRS